MGILLGVIAVALIVQATVKIEAHIEEKKDKIKIAEIEAKCFVYESALRAAGMKPLETKKKIKNKPEMGFLPPKEKK